MGNTAKLGTETGRHLNLLGGHDTMSNDVSTHLQARQQHELRCGAPVGRRVEAVPSRRSSDRAGELISLRDGSTVLVRPVKPSDTPLLVDGFARLSVLSRWRRFLRAKNGLTPAELRYFTDVDHYDHEALVAIEQASGRGVAIARYVRSAGDPTCAEVALTVIDDWQRRGLATLLLSRLSARALAAGVSRFTALVSSENGPVITLLRRNRAGVKLVDVDAQTLEYEIAVASFAGYSGVT